MESALIDFKKAKGVSSSFYHNDSLLPQHKHRGNALIVRVIFVLMLAPEVKYPHIIKA